MHETEELVADVLSSGAHGYVLKTDPSRHLLAAVEALARHACFITPSISDALVGSLGGRRGAAAQGARSRAVNGRSCGSSRTAGRTAT